MSKRTYASVTKKTCNCGNLQSAADDPDNPIRFEEETNEFHFVYSDGMLVIYHCPFCGGAAPESKRALLFAQIPRSEEERLAKLLHPITTIDDALKNLGAPDFDGHSTTKIPESDTEGPKIQYSREIRYERLSDVAIVSITERPDGKIHWQLQGKFLGRRA
jgi:hypothetical protein